jgi:tRNA1(Val) A37 N6-methylase TrmN6
MSIKTLNLAEFQQDFTVSPEDKLQYGEIYSPFSLIKNMFKLFDPAVFTKKDCKWLDTGAGSGYFSMILFDYLNTGLTSVILNEAERKAHILENMLYLCEVKPANVILLRSRFGERANIIEGDFLSSTSVGPASLGPASLGPASLGPASLGPASLGPGFDYIIGNPPYNAHGQKKVPTNSKRLKTQDGQTVWGHFLKKALTLLKPTTGQLCYIIPSIWMKPDKAGLYNILTSYKIAKLHCLTNTETNTLFKGAAQTPTCYFLLTNLQVDTTNNLTQQHYINLYDSVTQTYRDYPFTLGAPLPLFGQSLIQKLQPFLSTYIKVNKTNMPSKTSLFADTYDAVNFPYPNIKTCQLTGLAPTLIVNYSNIPQPYAQVTKLVLAHKMYGFPYLDVEGSYGISNRDNYVIIKPLAQLAQLQAFLSTKFALYVYEATRYRMKYLEKYAFEFLPDITQLLDFPPAHLITDETIATYFGLSAEERKQIQALHNKNYSWFL